MLREAVDVLAGSVCRAQPWTGLVLPSWEDVAVLRSTHGIRGVRELGERREGCRDRAAAVLSQVMDQNGGWEHPQWGDTKLLMPSHLLLHYVYWNESALLNCWAQAHQRIWAQFYCCEAVIMIQDSLYRVLPFSITNRVKSREVDIFE